MIKRRSKSAGEHRVFRILSDLCECAHEMFPDELDCTPEHPCIFCQGLEKAANPVTMERE